jgi:hypothetical protein
VKILLETLCRKLVPVFREPPVTIKDVLEAAWDPENLKPSMTVHWRN